MSEEMEICEISSWGAGEVTYYGSQSRTIPICAPIESELATKVISQLFQLNAESPEEAIIIHMNTEGGSVIDALAIYDAIKAITAPVVIIVMGACMSAGLVILSAAEARVATKNSWFFYHQMIMSDLVLPSQEHVDSVATYYKILQDNIDEKLRSRTKLSKNVWTKEFASRTSKFFSSEDALKFKFIDKILPEAKKPKIKLELE